MSITKANQQYITYRNRLLVWKSPKYIRWMHKKYPNEDLHHILGSTVGLKFADLVVPIEHLFHINKVEKDKPRYFEMLFAPAVHHLKQYAIHLGVSPLMITNLPAEPSPNELSGFFLSIEKKENDVKAKHRR